MSQVNEQAYLLGYRNSKEGLDLGDNPYQDLGCSESIKAWRGGWLDQRKGWSAQYPEVSKKVKWLPRSQKEVLQLLALVALYGLLGTSGSLYDYIVKDHWVSTSWAFPVLMLPFILHVIGLTIIYFLELSENGQTKS